MISFNIVQTYRCILSAQRKCLPKMEKITWWQEKQREKLLQTETNIGVAAIIHFLSYSTIYEDSLLPGNSVDTEDWEKSVRSNSGNCKTPGGDLHNSYAQIHPADTCWALKCSVCEQLCRHSDKSPDSPLKGLQEKLGRIDRCVLVSRET